jgi:hypothetical protein
MRGVPTADQAQVWDAIAAKADRLQAHSATGAMADIYDAVGVGVEEYVQAFDLTNGQTGAVFAIDGRPIGLDLFDSPRTLSALFPKLLRGYAIDAIDKHAARLEDGCASTAADADAARADVDSAVVAFLDAVKQLESKRFPGIGLGESWRFTSPTPLIGGALVVDDRIVHASIFRG